MQYRYLIAGAGLVVLAACSDTADVTPLGPTTAAVTSCNVNAVRKAAGNYFAGADRQTAFDLVKAMQDGAAQGAAFDLLALTGEVAGTARQAGTAADGSALANAALGCTGHGTAGSVDFVPALSAGGAFAVRGGAADAAGPVLARVAPAWGVEPANGETWASVTGSSRMLIYGNVRGSFATSEQIAGTAFEWARIPAGDFAAPVRVGSCQGGPDQMLIQHHESTSGDAVMLPRETLSFCGGDTQSLMGDGLFALVSQGPGGRVTTFSPFALVDAQATLVGFAVQPVTGTTGVLPAIEVLVTGAGGTPIEGATVRMTVAGNSGSYNFGGTKLQTTDGRGIATFGDLSLDKPGGYTLTATTEYEAFTSASVTSNLFNLKF